MFKPINLEFFVLLSINQTVSHQISTGQDDNFLSLNVPHQCCLDVHRIAATKINTLRTLMGEVLLQISNYWMVTQL